MSSLSQLVKAGKGQRVSGFLEAIFQANPDTLSFKQFDSVGHALTSKDRALAEDMAVRWLMSGNQEVCITHLIAVGRLGTRADHFRGRYLPLYALSDNEALFFWHAKRSAFSFFHQITAASLIICILRTVKGDIAEIIGDLLFEPLLLNYSGELRDHLTMSASKARRTVPNPICAVRWRSWTAYLNDLRAVGFVNELEPSEKRAIDRA